MVHCKCRAQPSHFHWLAASESADSHTPSRIGRTVSFSDFPIINFVCVYITLRFAQNFNFTTKKLVIEIEVKKKNNSQI